jgi:CHAD domain-containing protein
VGYRFEPDETVTDGVRRIAAEQIDKAVKELTDDELSRHEGVHQARKRFKKIRAVLRLVRPAISETYQAENAWFRDEARRLSRVRDAAALIETFDVLRETFADQADDELLDKVREALVERRGRIADEEIDLQEQVDALVAKLGEAKERVAGWTLSEEGFDAIGPGFKKTYGRGRKALEAAYADPTPENFHELRKRSKYHRYHIRALRRLWRKVLNPYRDAVHDLTDLLGENQDLRVLRETLLAEPETFGDRRDLQALLGLVDRRQAELRAEAEPLGRKVFAEKPKAFTARIGAYWAAWHQAANRSPVLAKPAASPS